MSRIILVTPELLSTGGQDRANLALASWLARRGHEVHVVAHEIDDELARTVGITWHAVKKPFASALLGESGLERAARALAERFPDARVIGNGGCCSIADVNWVHYVHARHLREPAGLLRRARYGVADRHFRRRENGALHGAELIIANSNRTRNDLVEQLGVDPERIRVIYYGSDPERFCPATPDERTALRTAAGWRLQPPAGSTDPRPAVLFIGALGDRRKGFDTVFTAWTLLCRNSRWDADLYVIGRGGELKIWESRVAEAGLAQRIRFLGFRNDVPALLRAADALVSPARYEPYGLAVHEAICCAIPAFASADAGVAERFTNQLQPLLLSDPNDARELANRLHDWRRDPQRLKPEVLRLSAQLRSRTWDDMGAEIEEAIKAAAAPVRVLEEASA